LLGARGAVATADLDYHALAAAADEGLDDRAAVPSPGGRGAAHRRRPAVNGAASRRRASLVWPSLVAAAAFIALLGLGIWQIERKAWKEGLIDALEQRLVAEPAPLPSPAQWASLDQDRDEFRRVAFSAVVAADEALVYTTGSAFRPDITGVGYWVFAPATLEGGATVVVNRGFVPSGQQAPETHAPRAGQLALTGVLRWPEPRSIFAPKEDDPARNPNLWVVRDQSAIAAGKGLGAVAPFYGELETPTGEGALPPAGRPPAN